MNFLKCNECKYEENCPIMWSYCNAACITIQKKKENIMDNSIYEVDRDDYVGFISQLNKNMMDVEQYYEQNCSILKIKSKNTGTHLCTRIIPSDESEHYYIFNMPTDEERIEPKPVLKITLNDKDEVQKFFNILNKLQQEKK